MTRSAATSASNSWRTTGAASVVDLGCVGHLNPASGYGRWSRAEQLIDELCARSATTPA